MHFSLEELKLFRQILSPVSQKDLWTKVHRMIRQLEADGEKA